MTDAGNGGLLCPYACLMADPRESPTPTLYEWAGGDAAFDRLINCFYATGLEQEPRHEWVHKEVSGSRFATREEPSTGSG